MGLSRGRAPPFYVLFEGSLRIVLEFTESRPSFRSTNSNRASSWVKCLF